MLVTSYSPGDCRVTIAFCSDPEVFCVASCLYAKQNVGVLLKNAHAATQITDISSHKRDGNHERVRCAPAIDEMLRIASVSSARQYLPSCSMASADWIFSSFLDFLSSRCIPVINRWVLMGLNLHNKVVLILALSVCVCVCAVGTQHVWVGYLAFVGMVW